MSRVILARIGQWSRPASGSSAVTRFCDFAQRHPLALASILLFVKGAACDVFVQTAVQRKKEWDKSRTAVLSLYGGLFEAPLAYAFYSILFPRFWPARTATNVFKMLLVDNLLLWPWLVYPTFYSLSTLTDDSTLTDAWQKYLDEFWEVNKVSMLVWIPTNIFNFTYLCPKLRPAFMALVALLYTSFWSFQQAKLRERPQGVLASGE
eukprot:GEMP01073380.1.p1 GENE.GEMP01073380.1~~GEMP01073380.1.p1  ORF type:complete len:207 (+),score=31.95 GEMP01073380.1:188-808(+)